MLDARGTTDSFPGPSCTSPASILIVSEPLRTRKVSSVSGWLWRGKAPRVLAGRTS